MQTPVMLEGTVRDNLCIGPAGVRGDFSEERLGGTLKETIGIYAANHAPSLLTDERVRSECYSLMTSFTGWDF